MHAFLVTAMTPQPSHSRPTWSRWVLSALAAATLSACGGGGGGSTGEPAPVQPAPVAPVPSVPAEPAPVQPAPVAPVQPVPETPVAPVQPAPIEPPSANPQPPAGSEPTQPPAPAQPSPQPDPAVPVATVTVPEQAAVIECAPKHSERGDRIEPMNPAACPSTTSAGVDSKTTVIAGGVRQRTPEEAQLRVNMPAPSAVEQASMAAPAAQSALQTKALQIGFARTLPASAQDLSGALRWSVLADGTSVAAVRISSATAAGLRATAIVDAWAAGAVLRWVDAHGTVLEAFDAQHIAQMLQRQHAAGLTADEARSVHSPFVDGDALVLELIAPAGVNAAQALRVRLGDVQHLQFAPSTVDERVVLATKSNPRHQVGACHIDSMCAPVTEAQRRSVARMIYHNRRGTFFCTGTLINNTKNDQTPYFATAAHCIADVGEAASLRTYWFYRSKSCDSTLINPEMKELSGGATLLYTSEALDFSLLRLNTAPPAGVVFQGVYMGSNAEDQPVWGLHNPKGAMQKFSAGSITGWASCKPTETGFSCTERFGPATSHHLKVNWTKGVTEGGSSGSGLLRIVDGQLYLVGVLSGGVSSCFALDGQDYYGRFDRAWREGNLDQWLSPEPQP